MIVWLRDASVGTLNVPMLNSLTWDKPWPSQSTGLMVTYTYCTPSGALYLPPLLWLFCTRVNLLSLTQTPLWIPMAAASNDGSSTTCVGNRLHDEVLDKLVTQEVTVDVKVD